MELIRPGDRGRAGLDRIRTEREQLLQAIENAGTARLSADDTIARLKARLREDIERAQQSLLAFSRPDVVPGSPPPADLAFLLWLGPDFEKALRARLKSLLPASAPTIEARAQSIAKLKAKLEALDRDEEAAVLKLIDAGLMVERRVDLDLGAIWGSWDDGETSAA